MHIPIDKLELNGELVIPQGSNSLVIITNGTSTSRFSIRNNTMVKVLQNSGISTFLIDLLTKEEEELTNQHTNLDLLTERLIYITYHLYLFNECADFKIGLLGSNFGAAVTLSAASAMPDIINAIVLKGGRPELAVNSFNKVKAPTLLIVGENDEDTLEINKKIYELLKCEKAFDIIPNASHLFKEHGTLHQVASHAADWYNLYFDNNKHELAHVS